MMGSSKSKSKGPAIFALAFFALLAMLSIGESDATARPGSSLPVGEHITKDKYAACRTRAALSRLVDLSGDTRAFTLFMLDPYNGCAILPAGEQVTLEDYSFSGIIRIRLHGDPESLWTTQEAIQ